MQLLIGAGAGGVAWLAVAVTKGLIDVAFWLGGADTRPVRLAKGGVDLALGGVAAYEAAQYEDDFWKGAAGVFGALEILSGGIETALAIHDYLTGSSGEESFDFQLEKMVAEKLSGRKWER